MLLGYTFLICVLTTLVFFLLCGAPATLNIFLATVFALPFVNAFFFPILTINDDDL